MQQEISPTLRPPHTDAGLAPADPVPPPDTRTSLLAAAAHVVAPAASAVTCPA